jgi:hypothetical protein
MTSFRNCRRIGALQRTTVSGQNPSSMNLEATSSFVTLVGVDWAAELYLDDVLKQAQAKAPRVMIGRELC